MNEIDIAEIKFDHDGLVPAVVQDFGTGTVLMVAYMNKESLLRTLEKGETYFWSRSRGELWHKGETSGHTQKVKKISLDCDNDALLIHVEQQGNACHTGNLSCFFTPVFEQNPGTKGLGEVVGALARVIQERKVELPPDSYTTYLFTSGLDKILKKVGEESAETIIAAKNSNKKEMAWEVADLLYHLLVLLAAKDITLEDISSELTERAGKKTGRASNIR